MGLELGTMVSDFAEALMRVDRRGPQHPPYQPGIGPHTEVETVAMVLSDLAGTIPERYRAYSLAVPYPLNSRQKCDLCIGTNPHWQWVFEVKMLRMMGDNGKPNDNMLMHILSPYSVHQSALTDCGKLASSAFNGRKAIMIYGYDFDRFPLDIAVEAFETLARTNVRLGVREKADFCGLIHPIHRKGSVFAWEIEK